MQGSPPGATGTPSLRTSAFCKSDCADGSVAGHFYGDIPMARDPATKPPTEPSTAERANRLCICKALILHGFSRALLPANLRTAPGGACRPCLRGFVAGRSDDRNHGEPTTPTGAGGRSLSVEAVVKYVPDFSPQR